MPWFNWNCDFGCGSNGGVQSTAGTIAPAFAQLRASDIHVVRWWMFPDGNKWQFTTDAGTPTGLNAAVYADMDVALALAAQYDLSFQFDLLGSPASVPAAWLDHPQAIADALTPLFARYAGNPHILAWEVFDEADFDIWNGKVTAAQVQNTVRAVAAAVHAHGGGTYATSSAGFADGLGFMTGLGLDYYDAHWYDYMGGGTYCMRCNNYAYYQARFGLDAPLVVGEFYAGPDVDALQRDEDFYAKGYAGAYAWSLFPDHTYDHMAIDLGAALTFAGRHPDAGPRAGALNLTPSSAAPATSTVTPSPTWKATSTPIGSPSPSVTTTPTPTFTATTAPTATATAAATSTGTATATATTTYLSSSGITTKPVLVLPAVKLTPAPPEASATPTVTPATPTVVLKLTTLTDAGLPVWTPTATASPTPKGFCCG
jgi:hypothetical protein